MQVINYDPRYAHSEAFINSFKHVNRTKYPFLRGLLNQVGYILNDKNGDALVSKYFVYTSPYILYVPPTIFIDDNLTFNGFAIGQFLKSLKVYNAIKIFNHDYEITKDRIHDEKFSIFDCHAVDFKTVLQHWTFSTEEKQWKKK